MNARFKRGLIEFEPSAETSSESQAMNLIVISGDSGWVRIRLSHSPGGDMKKNLMLPVLVSSMLLANAHAATKQEYRSATVVSVESRETPSIYAGSNPSDAPLQSEVYSYDIWHTARLHRLPNTLRIRFRLSAVSLRCQSPSRSQTTKACHVCEPSR